MIDVSIIVPVYNKEKYLRECLDCLINQTHSNIEIICVDDGSNDCSRDILNEYAEKDSRVIVICQENKGAGNARNVGIKAAQGKYMQFLDADDFFELTMVEEMFYRAENLSTDIVICNALQYDEETGAEEVHKWLQYDFVDEEPFSYADIPNIFGITTSCVWNKLYRSDFVRKNDVWYQEIPTNNDTAFAVITLFLAKRIACVDKCFIHYRFYTDTQRISSSREKHMKCSISAYERVLEELKQRKIYTSQIKKNLNKQMYNSATYELSFCEDEIAGRQYINQFCKIIQEPEKQKLQYYYDGFINMRKFYLFGFVPVLKSINLEKEKVFYFFNFIPLKIRKKSL